MSSTHVVHSCGVQPSRMKGLQQSTVRHISAQEAATPTVLVKQMHSHAAPVLAPIVLADQRQSPVPSRILSQLHSPLRLPRLPQEHSASIALQTPHPKEKHKPRPDACQPPRPALNHMHECKQRNQRHAKRPRKES